MIKMISNFSSKRLQITALSVDHSDFIFELVNSSRWLTYIGDRNIQTREDAIAYIEKIIGNPDIQYWTVRLKDEGTPIGIITLIKRHYLDHYDIGFAFLGAYTGKGYAAEATKAVLYKLPESLLSGKILAITTESNIRSVKLLEKLNFVFETTMEADGKSIVKYVLRTDALQIDKLTHAFYALFTNLDEEPQFAHIYELCAEKAHIIKKTNEGAEIYDLNSFIEPRKKILTDGTLTGFSEYETIGETRITGDIAQRYSQYEKSGSLQGNDFSGRGYKMFQFMKEQTKWKIINVLWEDYV